MEKMITLRLLTVKDKDVMGYSIHDDNIIQVELDKETYDKFEEDAKRFGMDVCSALGNALYTLIKNGLP